jgi:hypothetical protein
LKKTFYSFDKSDLQTGIFDGMNWIYRLLKKSSNLILFCPVKRCNSSGVSGSEVCVRTAGTHLYP